MGGFYFLLISLFLFLSCGDSDESYREVETVSMDGMLVPRDDYTQLQNQIFYGTIQIDLEITPKSNIPSFAWRTIGSRFMVLAVFEDKIDLEGKTITNPKDVVWTWHSGIGKGREGNVSFSDGVDVRNGEIANSTAVTSLEANSIYYVAIWGYDDAYNLMYSSKEYKYQTSLR
ncbi:hypothetical protein CMK22_02895 [Candidatus Poribacteria bacterium]|nr:hypothetical protein [Candidatus Poribacteria bacterium]|tara:strand:+ start:171 stop:689 length:519 start_codon:yes stop_codon:yes gene_type:complete